MSQFLRVERDGATSRMIDFGFVRQISQKILRFRELTRPVRLVPKFVEEPRRNALLLVWRQSLKLRDCRRESARHRASIPKPDGRPNIALHQTAAGAIMGRRW